MRIYLFFNCYIIRVCSKYGRQIKSSPIIKAMELTVLECCGMRHTSINSFDNLQEVSLKKLFRPSRDGNYRSKAVGVNF